VISGNTLNGVDIVGAGVAGNRIDGNTIGLDVTGTVDLGNLAFGVAIAQGASGNIVGEAGAGNVISGNDMAGVRIVDQNTNNNLVQLNYIGLDVTGTLARPNSAQGVILDSGAGAASGNSIGGAGLGNVISATAAGVGALLMTGTRPRQPDRHQRRRHIGSNIARHPARQRDHTVRTAIAAHRFANSARYPINGAQQQQRRRQPHRHDYRHRGLGKPPAESPSPTRRRTT
jgi:hypothetical protein